MFKSLSLALVLLFSFSAWSQEPQDNIRILLYSSGYIKSFLGPYPAVGSEGSTLDFDTLFQYQDTRTQEQCDEAASEENTSMTNMFAQKGGPLTRNEARILSLRLSKVMLEIGANIYIAKQAFKRPRPYITNPGIDPCIKREGSYAYPSGHTTMSRALARILSKLYPSRAAAFMKRADEIALHRVLGGVHHPTDIEAGKKFGDLIASGADR